MNDSDDDIVWIVTRGGRNPSLGTQKVRERVESVLIDDIREYDESYAATVLQPLAYKELAEELVEVHRSVGYVGVIGPCTVFHLFLV